MDKRNICHKDIFVAPCCLSHVLIPIQVRVALDGTSLRYVRLHCTAAARMMLLTSAAPDPVAGLCKLRPRLLAGKRPLRRLRQGALPIGRRDLRSVPQRRLCVGALQRAAAHCSGQPSALVPPSGAGSLFHRHCLVALWPGAQFAWSI